MVRKEELEYIKELFDEPDDYLHYTEFEKYIQPNFNKIPDENWWDEVAYLYRPVSNYFSHTSKKHGFDGKEHGITVCQCVWEMTGKNTHGAIVHYLREVIKAGGVMPVEVKIENGKIIELDGTHRVAANIQLGNEMIPVYVNREKQVWATCWRPGMISEDGTLDMNYDFSKEGVLL
jgi:hypothetical protein|tara:strand:- start:4712 stop:5239 length:528 start_codon:yes stop_codon:yes gene_type:complete